MALGLLPGTAVLRILFYLFAVCAARGSYGQEGERAEGETRNNVGMDSGAKTRDRFGNALWEAAVEREAWKEKVELNQPVKDTLPTEGGKGKTVKAKKVKREESNHEHTLVRPDDPKSHEFDDVDSWFFRRARKAERIRRMKGKEVGPRKVAFMFLTRGPMPLDAVWERFFRGFEELYSVYLLAPPGFEYNASTTGAPVFYGRQITPSFKVSWAGHGVLRAERRLIAAALTEPRNYMFVLLSDSQMFSSLEFDIYSSLSHEVSEQLCGQWFAIIRDHALEVINDTNIYDTIVMRSTHYLGWCLEGLQIMNEHYVQTLLGMKDPDRVENRPVTYVEWRPENFLHPHTFVADDLRRDKFSVIRSLNATTPVKFEVHPGWNRSAQCTINRRPRHCFLFARKFSSQTRHRLLYLTERIFFS